MKVAVPRQMVKLAVGQVTTLDRHALEGNAGSVDLVSVTDAIHVGGATGLAQLPVGP